MNYAIILAGGKGVRFEGNIPKQFVELMGEPLLVYSMKTAQENDNVDAICVVSPKEYYDRVRTWADKLSYYEAAICSGGRQGAVSVSTQRP
ncbi:MAG: 2-C-methyl-D-erythritol 4-phosphate cytidylyltransferase [Enterocloster clostridioformis]